MKKKSLAIYICSLLMFGMSSCVEELKTENFYTFTGETVADYLENRDSLSMFAEILRKSENPRMLELLDAYGEYTCFAPHNDAIRAFLEARGLIGVDQLESSTCDTIACTHVIKVEYPSIDMPDGVLSRPNMNDRYIQVKIDSGAMYVQDALIVARDEEVENGVVHVIDKVLQHSTTSIVDMISQDSRISLFAKALEMTGFDQQLQGYIDVGFEKVKRDDDLGDGTDRNGRQKYYPSARKIGYTGFIETNEVLAKAGVDTSSIDGLIAYAKAIYEASFEQDKGSYGDDEYTNPKHPLYRFVAYHFLNRRIMTDKLTTYLHFREDSYDATDFYETMCKGTIVKASRGALTGGQTRLNRRYFDGSSYKRLSHGRSYFIEGVPVIEKELSDGGNGCYYLIGEPLVYSTEVKDVVLKDRMRFDAATLMPELATNDIFRNGDGTGNEATRGKAYQIPNTLDYSYVENLKVYQEAIVYYQCPSRGFWCWYADEVIAEGSYDFAIKLPPVPEGTYEIRYGYVPMRHRGVTQVYIEEVEGQSTKTIPCGIPIDLTDNENANDLSPKVGWFKDDGLDDDEILKREKAMHNRGYMKGPLTQTEGANDSEEGTESRIARHQHNHLRRIVATKYLESGKDYYIRFRAVDESGKEFMFDYLELCPREVYDNPYMQEDRN